MNERSERTVRSNRGRRVVLAESMRHDTARGFGRLAVAWLMLGRVGAEAVGNEGRCAKRCGPGVRSFIGGRGWCGSAVQAVGGEARRAAPQRHTGRVGRAIDCAVGGQHEA